MRLGFDIGGTKVLAVVLDENDPRHPRAVRRAPTSADPALIVDTVAGLREELEAAVGERAVAVGVGIAGLVDREGMLHYSPNIGGVTGFAVGRELEQRLGLPVVVDNDATAATWAEAQAGVAAGHDHVAMVSLGTGIGVGFVLDGRLYRGAHGYAGESGHMVVDRNGPRHLTGARGPWELFASGTAFGVLAREAAAAGRAPSLVRRADGAEITDTHIDDAVAAGEPDMVDVVDEFADQVGLGIANLVHVLDPGVIVIGGGLVGLGDALIGPISRATHRHVVGGEHRPPVPVVAAELGAEAAAIGAALLADDR